MIIKTLKWPLRVTRNWLRKVSGEQKTRRNFDAYSGSVAEFDFERFSASVLEFVDSMRCGCDFEYKYSASCSKPTLYASAYACMTLSLLGNLDDLTAAQKTGWVEYFDRFQNPSDGLFYDSAIDSDLFRNGGDWWGARHLALHMISAYTDLGGRPRYPFRFLEEYYRPDRIKEWLDGFDWNQAFSHMNDIDNKIMNIGCLLQYQRDFWSDERAGAAVSVLQEYLQSKINPETGMWGRYKVHNPHERSRMVQFAYHLFPLYFYDRIPIQYPEKIIDHVLATQNRLGGFGIRPNSSACEDIDSIDLLIRLADKVPERRAEIDAALRKAFMWVRFNQVQDGGFVFRKYERMTYGHREMTGAVNRGAMFPTWFRTLTMALLSQYFSAPGFKLNPVPGYVVP